MLKLAFLLAMTISTAFAGHDFSYTYAEDIADFKVYIVDSAAEADIVAFKTNTSITSSRCWLKETYDADAGLKVLRVDRAAEADIKIYFTDNLEIASERCY